MNKSQLKKVLSRGTHQMLLHGKYIANVWKSEIHPDYSVSYSTDPHTHYNITEVTIDNLIKHEYLREFKKQQEGDRE